MTQRTPDQPTTPHAGHDRLLLVAGLDPDASAAEQARRKQQLESCAECRSLVAELALISAAVSNDLPRPARPRDFRLTVQQADRLRGSPLSRLLDRLAAPRFGSLQPLAGMAMVVGAALIVLSSTNWGFASSGAASPAYNANEDRVTVEGAFPTDALGGAPGAAASPSASGMQPGATTFSSQAPPQVVSGSPKLTPISRDTGSGAPLVTTQPAASGTTGAVLQPGSQTAGPQRTGGDRAPTAVDGNTIRLPAGVLLGGLLIGGGAVFLALRWLARRRTETLR